jgi:hypothetical protein
MSEIHVYTTEGVQSVHPEERVAELLQSGQLPPETLYWRQGMTDWQPLSGFKSSALAPTFVPTRHTEPLPEPIPRHARPTQPTTTTKISSHKLAKVRAPHVRFRRNPEPLTTVLQIFLILCIGLSGIDLANALVHYNLISTQIPDLTGAPGTVLPQIMGHTESLFFYGTMGVSLITLIPYLMWVYQANINSRSFSAIVRFSKGWAVWCHFVPAVNLFMPCQVMQEIWKVSRNPRMWHNDRGSFLVGTWWTLWLLRICAYLAYGVLCAQVHTEGDVATAVLIRVILFAIQLVFYSVFFAMITVIVQNQKQLVAAGRRKRMSATPTVPSAEPAAP